MMPIDYVIPFVDSSDREWVEEYRKYAPADCNWSSNATRFRDWDLLRYQLRSISRHLPWIHRIYIVLSVSEGQVPRWLNLDSDKVRVVWDWEFVPQEYLPTFNSNVIDLFIPWIEGLSEHYLYACDDYLILRDLQPADFFTENGIRVRMQDSVFGPSVYADTIKNSVRLLLPSVAFPSVASLPKCSASNGHLPSLTPRNRKYLLPYCDHAIIPHLRSENLRMMQTYEKEILASLSRFREPKNLTWLIYPLHLAREGRHESGRLRSRYHALYNEECIGNIRFDDCDVITLNDEYGGNFYYGKAMLGKMLENILPGKCEYEI